MNVQCDSCRRVYDDAERWTICPHSPLGGPIDDLCPQCDTLASRQGPCHHQVLLPRCGACGRRMMPENARIHPEFFLHDACLPPKLKKELPPAPANPLVSMLEAVLLFHDGGEWDLAKRKAWIDRVGWEEATTKVLCDAIRKALQ